MTRPDYCPVSQEPCQSMCAVSGVRCVIRDGRPQPAHDDTALLRQALAQLEINRTNFRKGPSKSICKMLAGGNDEVINALKERLNAS